MDFSDLRAFYDSGATRSFFARKAALEGLLSGVIRHEEALLRAMEEDLGKSRFEGYMTEVGLVRDEIRFQLKHLKKWMHPRRVPTPLTQFHAVSREVPEPYGLVLVMAPWNYPVQLSLEPLVGAIAAGNCVVLKPSNYAPHTAQALQSLIEEALPAGWARVVLGGRQENEALLDCRFDYIFFTGGRTVGRLVMEKAAQHLTPVSLELGGKSPVLVLDDADIPLAARRIVFGKLLNCGQTCVAPDYVLVQPGARERLIEAMKQEIRAALGGDPLANPEYPHIVNEKHAQRLHGLLEHADILFGGRGDGLKLEPTLVACSGRDEPVMQEEIFGPILPILTMDSLSDMIAFVRGDEKPLALYLFTLSKATERRVFDTLSFGGGCVNDTIIHLATPHMGFGGVGASGMGAYHGKKSFETFTHFRSVVWKSTWMDLPMRYHPYTDKKDKLVRFFLH